MNNQIYLYCFEPLRLTPQLKRREYNENLSIEKKANFEMKMQL